MAAVLYPKSGISIEKMIINQQILGQSAPFLDNPIDILWIKFVGYIPRTFHIVYELRSLLLLEPMMLQEFCALFPILSPLPLCYEPIWYVVVQ